MPNPRTFKGGKNSPEVMERRRKAVELRCQGLGYEEIARQLGYADNSGAYKAVQAGMKDAGRERSVELTDLEVERLDRLNQSHWKAAVNGDPVATDRILKIMKRRAELLGLDAPTKTDITSKGEAMKGYVGFDAEQV
jgi:transposase-like protein